MNKFVEIMAPKRSKKKLCCAIGCTNHEGDEGLSFFRAKRADVEQSYAWARAINRADENGELWMPSDSDRICSEHFISGRPSIDRNSLDYRPTRFATNHINISESAQKRFERVSLR